MFKANVCSKLSLIPRCCNSLLPSTSSTFLSPGISANNRRKLCGIREKNDFVPMKDWDFLKQLDPKFDRGERFGCTPDKWDYYNEIVWPPNYKNEDGNPPIPEVYHMRENIKYSPKKMWVICHLIRNLTVDEALKQLKFANRKGASIAAEVLEEAAEKAVTDHNIEFKSNLYIADCQAKQALIIKGVRRHARARFGTVRYRYVHLYFHLREGKPTSFNRWDPKPSGWDKMEEYVDWMRNRRIKYPV